MFLKYICAFLVVLVTSSYCSVLPTPSKPVFSDLYFVQGVILLPYAEIKEPFTAYYDLANKRSRVDYYGDLQQTYQRQDAGTYGVSYKIAYMPGSDPTSPERTCFQVNGTKTAPISVQTIVPDLTNFIYVGKELCPQETEEEFCEKWLFNNTIGTKENKYTMYITRTSDDQAIPVFYEMMGYDSLLSSHYDKYQISYYGYTVSPIPESTFEVGRNLTCRSFPGPGLRQSMHLISPIEEFIGHDETHMTHAFSQFKDKYSKKYDDDKEHAHRQHIFRQNFRYINSKNRAGLSFSLDVNHFTDFTDQEMKRSKGRLYSPGYNGGLAFHKNDYKDDLPASIDWRLLGAVTPVKDQAICGSCWSFGTVGTLEGAYFIKNKHLRKFSQQQLVDCSWNFQNNGCDGGEDFRAYQYILKYGLGTEDEYGPYLGVDGQCHAVNPTFTMTGYVNVTSGDEEALRMAIANHGPISVSIDASHKSLSFYSNGVYFEPDCMSKSEQLDHSVLAVGYGELNGEKYWLVKNSWSTYWGNDGYVLMSQKDNNCGVATAPTYVIL